MKFIRLIPLLLILISGCSQSDEPQTISSTEPVPSSLEGYWVSSVGHYFFEATPNELQYVGFTFNGGLREGRTFPYRKESDTEFTILENDGDPETQVYVDWVAGTLTWPGVDPALIRTPQLDPEELVGKWQTFREEGGIRTSAGIEFMFDGHEISYRFELVSINDEREQFLTQQESYTYELINGFILMKPSSGLDDLPPTIVISRTPGGQSIRVHEESFEPNIYEPVEDFNHPEIPQGYSQEQP